MLLSFQNSNEIGVFVKLTNTYCLAPPGGSAAFYAALEQNTSVPITKMSLAGTRIIGKISAGNSNGLLVPSITDETELKRLRKSLPESVNICKLDERLSGLGNCIVCNDKIGIIHPEIDYENEEIIADTLGIEVYRAEIDGDGLIGSYCVLNNYGGLLHPLVSEDDDEVLSQLLDIPLYPGTVNNGSGVISAGLVANDSLGLTGISTTPSEVLAIERALKLNEPKNDVFGIGIRIDLIEALV